MPSARTYRDDRDTRDRAPPPLPSLPRRSETVPNPSSPPLAQANMPPYAYYPPPTAAQAAVYNLPPTQPEPPTMHKVWILDCKSCGTFLTNRAMKAVLLLRPNVPLYSTDALPANCGVYSPSASRTSRSSRTSASSLSRTTSSNRDRDNTPRTCECLTQTLSCHSCGASVGYMIVMPCVRCTSSSFSPPGAGYPRSARPRATNGHRFVFHSSEVVGEERLYVSGEHGVLTEPELPDVENIFPGAPVEVPDYVRTFMPPYTARALTVLSVPNANVTPPNAFQAPLSPISPNGNASPHIANLPYPGYAGQQQHPASPTAGSPAPKTPKLRSGDVVYWHHLATRGDLLGVRDDERSRASCGAGSGRYFGDEDVSSLPGMPGAIWCAR